MLAFHQLAAHFIRHRKDFAAAKIRANQLTRHGNGLPLLIGQGREMLEITLLSRKRLDFRLRLSDRAATLIAQLARERAQKSPAIAARGSRSPIADWSDRACKAGRQSPPCA